MGFLPNYNNTVQVAQANLRSDHRQNVENTEEREELLRLQQRLESKIQVISPAIDMIELMYVLSLTASFTLNRSADCSLELRVETRH